MGDNLLDVAAVDGGEPGGLDVAEQVAGSTVDHLRGGPGGAGAEIVLLDQSGLEAAHRRVPRDAATVDAAADDDEVEIHGVHRTYKRQNWTSKSAGPITLGFLFHLDP